jgi:hypothetical protein
MVTSTSQAKQTFPEQPNKGPAILSTSQHGNHGASQAAPVADIHNSRQAIEEAAWPFSAPFYWNRSIGLLRTR